MRRGMMLAMMFTTLCVVPAWAGVDEGEAAYKRGDYDAALRECQPLAEEGNQKAQMLLDRMYLEGRGVPAMRCRLKSGSSWLLPREIPQLRRCGIMSQEII